MIAIVLGQSPFPVPTPDGPLSQLLRDPEGFNREALKFLKHLLSTLAWESIFTLLIVLTLVASIRVCVFLRDRRLSIGGRRVRILPPHEVSAAGGKSFWMGAHGLMSPGWKRLIFGQPFYSFEIVARPEEIEVAVWVPSRVPPGMIERAVESAWPGARAVSSPDEILSGPGHIEVTELGLGEPDWFPLGEVPGDPLTLVLGSMGGLADGEEALIQVLARPAPSSRRRRLIAASRAIRAGLRPGRLSWRTTNRSRTSWADPTREADVRAILTKASNPLFESVVRVAITSLNREVARGRIHAVAGAFSVFEGRNGFRRRRTQGAGCVRERRIVRPYLLAASEVSQFATLPARGSLPGLERASARFVPPGRAVPSEGRVIGIAETSGGRRPVAVGVEDARHHIHVVGETGTGKSTLLAQLVLQDAEAGRGAVVIDPKGDLIEAVLERLPSGSEERTCLLDAEDPTYTAGLNVLKGDDPDLAVEDVVGIFRRIFEPYWGPRTDHVMRAACLTLKRIPGATLAEVPQLLTNREWRREVIYRLRGAAGLNDFWTWFEKIPEHKRGEHTDALLNKVGAFLLRGPVRDLVGQSRPKRDVESLVDSGGLLLVRIPKGTIGSETSRLIGAIVVARVWHACMKRASLPESQRPDTTLYVDEMHNYLTLPRSFEDLLAEARGYHLSLVLAHQHMGQLTRDMRDALGANARTKVTFVVSPEDAAILERHFAPELSAYDLSHLAAFEGACRPSLQGGHGSPFTFRTLPLVEGSRKRAEAVRERSHALFSTTREKVDLEVSYRHRNAAKLLVPIEGSSRRGAHSGALSDARSVANSSLREAAALETAGEERS